MDILKLFAKFFSEAPKRGKYHGKLDEHGENIRKSTSL